MESKIKNKEKSLFGILEHPLAFEVIDEVLERKIVAIGNGAHINIPLKHLGKKAKITIHKKEEEESQ